MRTLVKCSAATLAVGMTLLAGALVVEIGNPAANPEALSKHAVLVARTTACHSPEKSVLTATAEGVIDQQRRSISLKLIPLSQPGTFAVQHEWPSAGTWVVKIVAKNPEYQNYATGALVPFDGNSAEWASMKHIFHEPTGEEVTAILESQSRASSVSPSRASVH